MWIRMVMIATLPLGGCVGVCGTGEYLFIGSDEDLATLQADGDGFVTVQERCGVIWDSFGLRSGGTTSFYFTPSLNRQGRDDLDFLALIGVVSSRLSVPDAELVEGARLTPTEGDASHALYLDDPIFRPVFALGQASLDVLAERGGGNSVSETSGNAVEWKIRWQAEYVDAQAPATVLQRIEGEDWIEVIDE